MDTYSHSYIYEPASDIREIRKDMFDRFVHVPGHLVSRVAEVKVKNGFLQMPQDILGDLVLRFTSVFESRECRFCGVEVGRPDKNDYFQLVCSQTQEDHKKCKNLSRIFDCFKHTNRGPIPCIAVCRKCCEENHFFHTNFPNVLCILGFAVSVERLEDMNWSTTATDKVPN